MDDDDPKIRARAYEALERVGGLAEKALRRVLDGKPSLEVREKTTQLLDTIGKDQEYPAETLRVLRSIQILEDIGTPAAREILKRLATGTPETVVTRQAAQALKRFSP